MTCFTRETDCIHISYCVGDILTVRADCVKELGVIIDSKVKNGRKLRPLVAGFLQRRPGFEAGSGHVGFEMDKVALGQLSPSTSVSPAGSSFHQLLHSHHHLSSEAGTIGQ
jgi:hypothetical protein